MIFLLCLMVSTICHAGRIPSGSEYEHFPNLRTVYHGHGATSYQNLHVQNHGDIPVSTKHHDEHNNYVLHDTSLFSDYNHKFKVLPVNVIPYADTESIGNHFVVSSTGPFGGSDAGHLELLAEIAQSYYDHYDHDHEFEYH